MPMVQTDKDGNTYHYNDARKLHREDGPACEYANGDKHWYINGRLQNKSNKNI